MGDIISRPKPKTMDISKLPTKERDKLCYACRHGDMLGRFNVKCVHQHNRVLCQYEIDELLSAINGGGMEKEIDMIVERDKVSGIEAFESILLQREEITDRQYAMFERNVQAIRFFDNPHGLHSQNVLQDIRMKNEAKKMGNKKIPGTNIELINYSYCPKCNHIYDMSDLMAYYAHPIPDKEFKNTFRQCRTDTRMHCHECNTYFLPSIIIVDGDPKNEFQFLCRAQTVSRIESFYMLEYKKLVLTQNELVSVDSDHLSYLLDVRLSEMSKTPSLITNLMQYSPAKQMLHLIEDKNIEERDLLYNLKYNKKTRKPVNVEHY